MKYRGGWPRLVHLSADYARDYGTTTTCPCGLKARYTLLWPYVPLGTKRISEEDTMQSCWPPSYTEPRPGQCIRTTGEQTACIHDATSASDHEDNLDGQSDKQGSMEDLLIRKNLRWIGHLMRMSPEGYQSRFSTVNCLLVTPGLRIPPREN